MALNITTLVIGGDEATLSETLFGLSTQSRQSDQVLVLVFNQKQQEQAVKHNFPYLLTQESSFQAIRKGVNTQSKPDWFWILSHDSCPDPDALSNLAIKAEVSLSAGVIAPKLVQWDQPRVLKEYGLSLTTLGAPFSLVENEIDQGQFDTEVDVLGASLEGSLIESDVFLGHLDNDLPLAARGLELGIGAWVSARRVLLEPKARVRVPTAHQPLGLKPRLGATFAKKHANLYLNLVTLPLPLLILRLMLLPLTSIFSVAALLISKRPNEIPSELLSWVWVWLRLPRIFSGQRRVRSGGQFANLSGLRVSSEQIRARREKRFSEVPMMAPGENSLGLFGGVWAWLLPILIILNFQFWPTAPAVTGGAVIPVSSNLRNLFEATQATDVPADPVSWWLLLLGATTFWEPSLGIALALLLGPVVAFAGAWKLVSVITTSNLIRTILGLVYGLSPILAQALTAVSFMELSAVALLPWFVFSLARLLLSNASARAWRWSAWSGILFGLVSIVSPMLFAVLVPAVLILAVAKWRRAGFVFWIFIPPLVINYEYATFLIVNQPLGLSLSAGLPVPGGGGPLDYSGFGWTLLLLVPFCLAGLFLGQRTLSIWLLGGVALLLLLIRVLADIDISIVTATGIQQTQPSTSALAALALLTLIILIANSYLLAPRWLQIAISIALLPSVVAGGSQLVSDDSQAEFVSSKAAPAIVVAESAGYQIGSLVITNDEVLTIELVSGDGKHLEDLSRLKLLGLKTQDNPKQLADLGASLLAGNQAGLSELLTSRQISFVLLTGFNPDQTSELDRLVALEFAGETEFGKLWRTDYQPLQRAALTLSQHQGAVIISLLLFLLVSIPTRASIRGRAKVENEIFGEVGS